MSSSAAPVRDVRTSLLSAAPTASPHCPTPTPHSLRARPIYTGSALRMPQAISAHIPAPSVLRPPAATLQRRLTPATWLRRLRAPARLTWRGPHRRITWPSRDTESSAAREPAALRSRRSEAPQLRRIRMPEWLRAPATDIAYVQPTLQVISADIRTLRAPPRQTPSHLQLPRT